MISLAALLQQQLLREFLLATRQVRFIINACLFFFMIMVLFPLSMPLHSTLLAAMFPGLLWMALLLALLLSAERLFLQDYEDGVLEQWVVSGFPLSLFVMAKIGTHWLLSILPLLFLCPLLALMFSLNLYELWVLVASVLAGTPAILFLCALATAFSLGLRQQGMFMALIVLPLTVPVMIFGGEVLYAAMQGLPVQGYLALLMAISLIAIGFLPFAIASVLRANIAQ